MNKMTLEKEITRFGGKKIENYFALYEDINNLDILGKIARVFLVKPNIVLNLLDKDLSRIKVYVGDKNNVIKSKENYYDLGWSESYRDKKQSKRIDLNFYEVYSKGSLVKWSISNLNNIIENKEVSMGDKKIIKDIAICALDENLDLILNPKQKNLSSLIDCVRVDLREDVRYKLASYGFELKKEVVGTKVNILTKEMQKVKFVNLKQKDSENYFSRNTNL